MSERILTEQEIRKFFPKEGELQPFLYGIAAVGAATWYIASFTIAAVIAGILLAVLMYNYLTGRPDPEKIDAEWHRVALSRETIAYQKLNFEKEEAIRDAQYFFAYPEYIAPDREYGEVTLPVEGKHGESVTYRNHQRIVWMIYGRDQLMTFDETICLENLWDSRDRTSEFFWQDVSSIDFDERTDTLEVVVGGKTHSYPLTGGDGEGGEAFDADRAVEIANGVRTILREKKSALRAS
jgi:hypothetical protein